MKKTLTLLLTLALLITAVGCSVTTTQTGANQYDQATDVVEESSEELIEEYHEPITVGSMVTSNDWKIKLTDAYTSTRLESSESRTAWDANDGYSFLVLEFDITCLNSSKPTIDGDAITELIATAGGNTYEGWEYQYVNSEIWCYIRNTCLEANLPLHIYVYTMIPRESSNVSVELKIAGQPKQIAIY